MPEKTEPIRLLFVDDEEGIRITLAALLTRNGFDVTAVATVRDALTQVNWDSLATSEISTAVVIVDTGLYC
jgi:DNA-binding NtrC family response regulator